MNDYQKNSSDDAIFIDLGEMIRYVLHYWWVIVIAAVVTGGLGFCKSTFLTVPTYSSSTTMYVLANSGSHDNVTSSDFTLSTQISTDLTAIVKSRMVLETVIEEQGLNMSYKQLASKVSVNQPSNSARLVNITVTDTLPERAMTLADAIREKASEHIKSVMRMEAVSVVDYAYYPTETNGRNTKGTTLKTAAMGIILAGGVLVLLYLLNDTISTSEEAERRLGMTCLAVVPKDKNFAK